MDRLDAIIMASDEWKAVVITMLLYVLLALVVRRKEVRRLDALYPEGWEEVLVDEWMWGVVSAPRKPTDWSAIRQNLGFTLIPFACFATLVLVCEVVLAFLRAF